MKRYVKILLITALCASLAAVSASLAAFAEKSIVSDKYTFIGNPSYIYCGGSEILILGSDKLLVYSYDYSLLNAYDLPGAVKIEKNDRYTVYSAEGGIYLLGQDGTGSLLSELNGDFCLAGNTVYIASGRSVVAVSAENGDTQTYPAENQVTSLCFADGKVYFSAKGDRFGYGNIYRITDGGAALAYDYCKNLSYLIGGETLMYYGAGKTVNPENGAFTAFPGDEAYVAAHGSGFYYVTASGELYFTDKDGVRLIFACTSGDEGYFAFPEAVVTDYGKLFALDYANDRIAVMENGIAYINIRRPVAMTADYAGNLYIYGKDGLFKTNVNSLSAPAEKMPYSGGAVTSMTYSGGTLYLVSGGKAYSYSGGETRFVCDADIVRSEYFGGEMYFLRGDGIYKTGYDYPTVKITGVTDFDVAADGSIYVLKDGDITKYSQKGEAMENFAAEEGASALSISVVTNDYTDYGDIIITCTAMHKIYNLRPSTPIAVPEANLQYTDTDSIIRTALEATYIYEYPCSVSKTASVPAGATLITGKYDLYETERMSYVLYEDFSGLKTGYIYKGMLSLPAEEKTPSASDGRTLYDNTALYRFPSAKAEKLLDNIGKNVSVSILPFSDYSHDGVVWLKVRYGANTGFVAKDMISTGKYVSGDERPQYNAKLTKEAEIYDETGGVYVPTGYKLPSGTDVEIVGIFDQSSRYTAIKYFDEEKGLREGYVLTAALTSYAITVPQIIGIVCVGIIAILLVSVCVIRFAGKRRRQLSKK